MPNPKRNSGLTFGFKPTPARKPTSKIAKAETVTYGREVNNPLSLFASDKAQESEIFTIVRQESKPSAEMYQYVCRAALQSATPSFSGNEKPTVCLDRIKESASIRQKIIANPGLNQTDPDTACLLLRHLLDTQIQLAGMSDIKDAVDSTQINALCAELQTLQEILRQRALSGLSHSDFDGSLPLALNYLSLGALALILKNLANKSVKPAESSDSAAAWQMANPLRKAKPIAGRETEAATESLIEILSTAASEGLAAHQLDPVILSKLADISWLKGPLAAYLKADDLDSNLLMDLLIRHTQTLRHTHKAPIEISLLRTLAYLVAGAATALFMKSKAKSPFNPDAVIQSDTDSLFTPLHATSATPTPVSATSLFTNNTLFNQSASASASALPSNSASSSATRSANTTRLSSPSPTRLQFSASALATGSASASPLSTSSPTPMQFSATASGSRSTLPTPSPTSSALITDTWALALGGASADVGNGVLLGRNGSVVVAGYTSSFGAGSNDVLLTSIHSNGTLAWTKTLGGVNDDKAYALASGPDDSILVVGDTANNIFVAKVYTNGTLCWAKAFGAGIVDTANVLAVDTYGNIIITGYTYSSGSGDVLLAKIYTNGTMAWINVWTGPTALECGNAVAINADGSIIVTGRTDSYNAGIDALIAKVYANGTLAWAKALGGSSSDDNFAIATDYDGNMFITGYTSSFGAGSSDVLLTSIYSNGTLAWAKTLGGGSDDRGEAMALLPDGSVLVAGATYSFGAGNRDVFLAKVYANGSLAWAETLGTTSSDYGYGLALSSNGMMALTGYTGFGAGNADVLIAKLDAQGKLAFNNSLIRTITTAQLLNINPNITDITNNITLSSSAMLSRDWNPFNSTDINPFVVYLPAAPSPSATPSGTRTPSSSATSSSSAIPQSNIYQTNNTWALALGGTAAEKAYGLANRFNGSNLIAGYTNSFGVASDDVLLAEINANGSLQFAKALGGGGLDFVIAIASYPDGGFVVAGATSSFGAGMSDFLLAQWYSNNTLAWTKTLGGSSNEEGRALALHSDGSILMAGYTSTFGAGNLDTLVTKLDFDGNLIWAKTFGGAGNEKGYGLAFQSDDSIILAGTTTSFNQGQINVFVSHLAANGSLIWARALGQALFDGGKCLGIDANGNIFISGQTQTPGTGLSDAFLAKLAANGTLLWAVTLGGVADDYITALALQPNGNVLIAGETQSFGAVGKDMLLAQFAANGTALWIKTIGGIGDDTAHALHIADDGSIRLAGFTNSFGVGNFDALLATLNSDGNLSFNNTLVKTIMNADIRVFVPNFTDITSSISLSSPAISVNAWNSMLMVDIYPNLTQIAASGSARRRLAEDASTADKPVYQWPSHRASSPTDSPVLSATPLFGSTESRPMPIRALPSFREFDVSIDADKRSLLDSSSYGLTATAAIAGLCLILLFIWRFAHSRNSCGRARGKSPIPQTASDCFDEKEELHKLVTVAFKAKHTLGPSSMKLPAPFQAHHLSTKTTEACAGAEAT